LFGLVNYKEVKIQKLGLQLPTQISGWKQLGSTPLLWTRREPSFSYVYQPIAWLEQIFRLTLVGYDSTMKMEPRTDVSQIEQSYVAVPSLM